MPQSLISSDDKDRGNPRHLAEAIRTACIRAALDGYQDASMSGLCHEGAWEMAIDAIRTLDLELIVQELNFSTPHEDD